MYEQKEYKVICSNCKSEFDAKQIKLENKIITMLLDNEQMQLTYYCCPACKKEFHIILGDEKILHLVNRYESQLAYLQTTSKRLGNPKKSDILKMLRLKQELKHKYDELNVRYQNSFYQFEGKTYKLELSVPDHILDGGK